VTLVLADHPQIRLDDVLADDDLGSRAYWMASPTRLAAISSSVCDLGR